MSWIAEKNKVAESERARRASEDCGARGAKLAPDPEVTERVGGSPRSTSYALFAKPTPVRAMAMWARCCAARVCIPRSCRAGVTNARRLLRPV